ncbi:hypothetical protein DFR24_2495 [Panacagrimonas perspica]|uniref:Uncharacterized protein n=1 Tax=Panacagrimonas perspica TaxID=381431 RepID=A0A4S3JYJ1_9GAMM|nr:hypothetical protein [Panacagrimonas perspica]TDU28130.1 hypothetical protein DFR24_2495 [Panacagrimonas perspica]THD00629.1 hypothetical protein B1810_23790 [Panacagrimonas perspica]
MQARPPSRTLVEFLFRFAALAILTIAVLASVAVRASRDEPAAEPAASKQYVPDTAEAVNDRRYPMVYADAAARR